MRSEYNLCLIHNTECTFCKKCYETQLAAAQEEIAERKRYFLLQLADTAIREEGRGFKRGLLRAAEIAKKCKQEYKFRDYDLIFDEVAEIIQAEASK